MRDSFEAARYCAMNRSGHTNIFNMKTLKKNTFMLIGPWSCFNNKFTERVKIFFIHLIFYHS
jgi:hypothetical protein